MNKTESQARRRRWINLGELIALAALVVSAVGVWIAWKSSNNDKPTTVVEQHQPIPLILRGTVQDNGREMTISPVDPSHALESLSLFVNKAYPLELGSDGKLSARDLETKLTEGQLTKGSHSIPVGFTVHYAEMGKDREATPHYTLRYVVEGGGLFGGRSLHLVGLSR